MNNDSIHICNLLRREKRQSELYIGYTPYYWEYMVVQFSADCTEALPLTLLDKTICGVLNIDGRLTVPQLGSILGLNVNDDPAHNAYRDAAEDALLNDAIRSLLDYNMIERDFSDGSIDLTDIGREYYRQGKKFHTIEAKSFHVFFDRTTGVHGKARKIFSDAMGRTQTAITPPTYKNEQFLKSFIHEQLPAIYDTQRGNSFTNVTCSPTSKSTRILVQVGVFYDVTTREYRYVAVLDDKICPELNEIIASNDKLRQELEVQVRVLLKDCSTHIDRHSQEEFEASILEGSSMVQTEGSISKMIPSVIEQEEFWQCLPLLVDEKETSVFLRARVLGKEECKAIAAFCDSRPGTNVFLSFLECQGDLSFKNNLFYMDREIDEDYTLCTPNVTYTLRGYLLHRPDGDVLADMLFRYDGSEFKETDLRGLFAVTLLPKMYKDTMVFLDTDFDIAKRSVRSIAHCDSRINVFKDFLNDESIAKLQEKKQEVFNRVKLDFEKTLVDKVTAIAGEKDLEEIDKVKELEEIATRVDDIMKDGDETYVTLMETGKAFKQALKERERTIKDELMAKTYIIDTNVFLNDPEILTKIKRPNRVVLSGQVLQELDKKKNKAEDPALAANARKAVGAINAMREKDKKAKKKFLLFEYADMTLLPEELQTRKGDNFILGVAMKFRENNPWLITSDNIFGLTAESLGIPAVTLEDFYTKNGLVPPQKPSTEGTTPKTYKEVFQNIYDAKGYVLLSKFEKECQKAGIKPSDLGHETYIELVESDPDLFLSTNSKGTTYVNHKR